MATIPTRIDTRQELESYLIQHSLNHHGFPLELDGIRGHHTEKALDDLFKKLEESLEIRASNIPKYMQYAQEYIGINEISGSRSNKTILGWIKSFFSWAKDDGEIAWCAIFINIMLKRAGIKGTGKANAKSFLDWGVKVENPQKGDIVIFDRGKQGSWQGHVGIFAGLAGNGYIYVLGGNQSNGVNIRKYSTARLRGYRRAK